MISVPTLSWILRLDREATPCTLETGRQARSALKAQPEDCPNTGVAHPRTFVNGEIHNWYEMRVFASRPRKFWSRSLSRLGYRIDGIRCWRERRSTKTSQLLAENILIMHRS